MKQYVDWGDVTVQVDPLRRQRWIRDDGYHGHFESASRGMQFDEEAMARAQNWVSASDTREQTFFLPTTAQLDALDKYAEPIGSGCVWWRGQKRDQTRFGKLPVISQQLYDDALPHKDKGTIEHEIREADRRLQERLFNRDGYTR